MYESDIQKVPLQVSKQEQRQNNSEGNQEFGHRAAVQGLCCSIYVVLGSPPYRYVPLCTVVFERSSLLSPYFSSLHFLRVSFLLFLSFCSWCVLRIPALWLLLWTCGCRLCCCGLVSRFSAANVGGGGRIESYFRTEHPIFSVQHPSGTFRDRTGNGPESILQHLRRL